MAEGTKISESLASLPRARDFGARFSTISKLDYAVYRAFLRDGERRLDTEALTAYLAFVLQRPVDGEIRNAVDTLTPDTTVQEFLSRLHPQGSPRRHHLEQLLEISDGLAFSGLDPQRRLEIYRRVLLLRESILFRLATLPDAASGEDAGAILTSYLDSRSEDVRTAPIAVAVPALFFPRRWDERGRRWRQPNGIHLLRDWHSVGKRKAKFDLFLALSGRGLGGLSDSTGLVRYLGELEAREPGLIAGVQIGDALREQRAHEPISPSEKRVAAKWLREVFEACAKRNWIVRIDAFAFTSRGILHEALAEAVRTYEGAEVTVCLGHIAALDETWLGRPGDSAAAVCRANRRVRFEFEAYPAFSLFAGLEEPQRKGLVSMTTLRCPSSLETIYTTIPEGCSHRLAGAVLPE